MADIEIVTENLHAVQAIYFAYQLEQMRLFDVVERIVELYQQGLLPLGTGSAAESLRDRVATDDRLSAPERAYFYARALRVERSAVCASACYRGFARAARLCQCARA